MLLGHEIERKVEAAGLNERHKGLEPGHHAVALPAGDLSAILARPFAQLGLREPGAKACLTQNRAAATNHRLEVPFRCIYATRVVKISDQLAFWSSESDTTQDSKPAQLREGTRVDLPPVSPSAAGATTRPTPPPKKPDVTIDVPRVMLTICEAAHALGVSTDTFRRFVLPELRVVRASPRMTLVRVAELERWAARREALAELE